MSSLFDRASPLPGIVFFRAEADFSLATMVEARDQSGRELALLILRGEPLDGSEEFRTPPYRDARSEPNRRRKSLGLDPRIEGGSRDL